MTREGDPEWAASAWAYLKRPSPKVFGGLAEEALAEWLGADPRRSTDHDLCLGSMEIEVKAATSHHGLVVFNQIRAEQRYTHVLFLAFMPHDVRGWLATKDVAAAVSLPQHRRDEQIRMLRYALAAPPAGLLPRSGALDELRAILPASHAFPWPA